MSALGGSLVDRAAQLLRLRPALLLLEPPLDCGLRRLRRPPSPRDGERLAQLRDEPLDCELAVARLASLVLRDRTQHRPAACDDAPLLHVRQRARALDVEQSLDPRLGLLRVLSARSA